MMKCQNTPRCKNQNISSTPLTTTFDFGTPRKRVSARKSRYSGAAAEFVTCPISQSPNNWTDTRPNATQKQRSNQQKRESILSPISTQILNDDVFQPSADNDQNHSFAISQFRDAARRLAQPTVATHGSTRCFLEQQNRSCIIQESAPPSEYRNFSRPTTRKIPPSTPLYRKYTQERDITSAWKKNVGFPSHQDKESRSPLAKERTGKISPMLHRSNHHTYDGLTSTIAKPLNFSRTVTYPQPHRLQSETPCNQRSLLTTTTLSPINVLHNGRKSPQPLQNHHRRASKPVAENSVLSPKRAGFGNAVPALAKIQTEPLAIEDPIRASFDCALAQDSGDKSVQLKNWEIWFQRILFSLFVFCVNIALGLAYLGSHKHPYLLAILAFMKSKDILSTIADIFSLPYRYIHNRIWPRPDPKARWILSLVCAYAETEEQIMKTVLSLVTSETQPHKQIVCIILDGKTRNILSKMTDVRIAFQRPYTTWRSVRADVVAYGGHIEGIPTILLAKVKNAGKKDSLILGHDLFNHPREDMPQATKLLRQEIWQKVIPSMLHGERLDAFDFIFCTDADSSIHKHALRRLADSLCHEVNAVAACGVLMAEFGDARTEFSPWHLFQQFQYTFGQYVRRQAESTWGRVTCLPGCITMIVVRPELSEAISEYARPVVDRNIFRHQVQYLGTDRRLTWCIMSRNKHLRTIFVPNALSETVVPNSLSHYLSQRRRWASNAYFNDFFYALGPRQRLVTRLFALIDLVRLTLVFYRVFNTVYFIHGLWTNFYVIKIIPTLIVTKTPATWYLILVMWKEPLLRKRLHKVILGMCINQIISPFLSVIVFFNVLFHLGSQSWGQTGVSTQGPTAVLATIDNEKKRPLHQWTPRSLAKTIRKAIRGRTPTQQWALRIATPPPTNQADTASLTTNEETLKIDSEESDASGLYSTSSAQETHSTWNTTSTPPVLHQNTPSQTSAIQGRTPISLLRRTQRQRKHSGTMLGSVSETPTRNQEHPATFEFDFHKV